jgi:hypothetical protein
MSTDGSGEAESAELVREAAIGEMRDRLRCALERRTSAAVTEEQFDRVWTQAVVLCSHVARQVMERDPHELIETVGIIDPSERWILEAVLL